MSIRPKGSGVGRRPGNRPGGAKRPTTRDAQVDELTQLAGQVAANLASKQAWAALRRATPAGWAR